MSSDSVKVKLKLSIINNVIIKMSEKDYELLADKLEEDGSVPLDDTSIFGKVMNSLELDIEELKLLSNSDDDDLE